MKELIIDDSLGSVRAAVLEDGLLCEIHAEKQKDEDLTECLFYGRIVSIRPSINAAFVDIGEKLHAFLPMSEGVKLKCGDMLIVQGLAQQATESKGLRISQKLNLAGKWLVLIPEHPGVHISKKVKDPQLRDALLEIGREICPDGCGLIIRTASEDVTQELLCEEAQSLYALWLSVKQKAAGMKAPGLLHRRIPLPLRLARDLRHVDRVVVNSTRSMDILCAAQRECMISDRTILELFEEKQQLIFDAYQIEPQIDKALKKRVWLPCGGYLIIDYCEAMTVIDVNSGKMILGRELEETAFRVNLQAADEIARQLRLRDIGGIVMIDFIDMKLEENRKALLDHMRNAASRDRTQVSIEGMTRLGLMELSRKRIHTQLHKALRGSCSYCSGMGEILSAEETAVRALRQVRRQVIAGQRGPFVIRCAAPVFHALIAMHVPENTVAYAAASSGRHVEKYEIEQIGSGISIPKEAVALKQGD